MTDEVYEYKCSDEEYQIIMVGQNTITILKIVNSTPKEVYEVPYNRYVKSQEPKEQL